MITRDRPSLHVEGKDDRHSIVHLMRFYGVDYDPKPWPSEYPLIKEKGDGATERSVERLLEGIEVAIKAAAGSVVGFVLDADTPLQSRWDAVRARLSRVSVESPQIPSAEGFIGTSTDFKCRVGVWLMPDNENDGYLETFLKELIDENDLLIGHAEASTETAKQLGAKFSVSHQPKAILHCWLAWQKEPGLPFGTALKAKYFRPDKPAGDRFASWFKNLFHIA